MGAPGELEYTTAAGIRIVRTTVALPYENAIEPVIDRLDSRQGVLLASTYEFPGRYSRWDIGFTDPPLTITARGRDVRILANNHRGGILLGAIARALRATPGLDVVHLEDERHDVTATVHEPEALLAEEQRSKQNSTFTVIRALRDAFASPRDSFLGLYGAFGYDLALQFQRMDLYLPRPDDHRDLVLFLPDSIVVVDHSEATAVRHDYDWDIDGRWSDGMPRDTAAEPYEGRTEVAQPRDMEPGGYAALTREAQKSFAVGDLFEVVPSQVFREPCPAPPSEVFRRLRERNPAPYGGLLNLGDGEYLVSASPEMFVRVDGSRVESCPISGTVARGTDVLSDAEQIATLLASKKDEAELTMCTDVDRNDKSRVCEPGTVEVIGRRQIEMYSRLIHTVDHVEGILRPEYDALDAFLTHTWAVTVTGAPKLWAMRFIERHERSPRVWYGGAFGMISFDGSMNTGLTLRTARIKDGIAEVRAGATLLSDSVPEAEEAETELKASALIDAITRPRDTSEERAVAKVVPGSAGRMLLIDHDDSFVHTLANYFRQAGAEVMTVRAGFTPEAFRALIDDFRPDLVTLSPGPGKPEDFRAADTIRVALDAGRALFGVCLGLQAIVEYFGGTLGQLDEPMHGKPSEVFVQGGRLFQGLPVEFTAGRYHSLFADRATFPADELEITAVSDDEVIMAVEHRTRPVAAVQFHPESIMTLKGDVGPRLVRNVLTQLRG